MKVEIQTYKDDVVICLPDELLEAASAKTGDYFNVEIDRGIIVLSNVIHRKP